MYLLHSTSAIVCTLSFLCWTFLNCSFYSYFSHLFFPTHCSVNTVGWLHYETGTSDFMCCCKCRWFCSDLYSPSGQSAQSCSAVKAGGCWARQRWVCHAHRRLYHWCNESDRQASVCFCRWHNWNTVDEQEKQNMKTFQIQATKTHSYNTTENGWININ